MNEAVMQRPAAAKSAATKPRHRTRSNTAWGYMALAVAITAGWVLRERLPITAEEGIGYWLGIAGGSLMLALLLYPLRKRIRLLHVLGPTKYWFRLHMVFGLIGPLLILYHCSFTLGSVNSRVAFYCMLLVAGSGVIGRHFYAGIHRGLYGRKTSLRELQAELGMSAENSQGLSRLMPEVVHRLGAMSDELQGDRIRQTLGIGRSLRWTLTHHLTRLSLMLTARRELRAAAASSPAIRQDYRRLRRSAFRYIGDCTGRMGRVAQFSFYERLFALWHVFHLPIFFMMVLSALFHVLAVHMY